jgi:hypothetical protein
MAFNFPDGASNGQTHTASNGTVYRYNGTTWVVDSAATTTTFDSKYLNTNGDGIVSGSTQIANLGYVSSSTVDTIQVMTTASYQAITPVSGTLYIIQG